MDFPTSFLYNPQYFDVIVRATGLLSGNQRFERIKEVASKNIWLAARCKNTCVSEEQEIVDWLIIRSSLLYNRFNDIQAIIALMELKEWGVILSFFGSKLCCLIICTFKEIDLRFLLLFPFKFIFLLILLTLLFLLSIVFVIKLLLSFILSLLLL